MLLRRLNRESAPSEVPRGAGQPRGKSSSPWPSEDKETEARGGLPGSPNLGKATRNPVFTNFRGYNCSYVLGSLLLPPAHNFCTSALFRREGRDKRGIVPRPESILGLPEVSPTWATAHVELAAGFAGLHAKENWGPLIPKARKFQKKARQVRQLEGDRGSPRDGGVGMLQAECRPLETPGGPALQIGPASYWGPLLLATGLTHRVHPS